MTTSAHNNDRFPTDLHLLALVIAACAALALMLPTAQVQSFTGLLGLALQARR